jgi:dTDP-4-amino-4,6-dideoxygalactose transaminase
VLNAKLPHLDAWTQGRRRNAARYNRLFIEAGLAEETGRIQFDERNKVLMPKSIFEKAGNQKPEAGSQNHFHIYNQYCIRVQNRDGLIAHLRANNIGCEIYYPVPFHKQECFADVPSSKNAFPHSDFAAQTILALPIYPELTEEMQTYVVETIRSFIP